MFSMTSRNPDESLINGLWYLSTAGLKDSSRNGPVLRSPGPVITHNVLPLNRVSLNPIRDANPYLHLMEAMWILAGSNDVSHLSRYSSRMMDFSDDGLTLAGGYGHRIRHQFEFDQLEWLIEHLRKFPNSRRGVISMWDPFHDTKAADTGGLDVPCNDLLMFSIRNGKVDMTINCRSNDLIWGLSGANAVHFSYILEYVAASLNLYVGSMYQFSNDVHVYTEFDIGKRLLPAGRPFVTDWSEQYFRHAPLFYMSTKEDFDFDCKFHFEIFPQVATCYRSWFFNNVVAQMCMSHDGYLNKNKESAFFNAKSIQDEGWRIATTRWLERRKWT